MHVHVLVCNEHFVFRTEWIDAISKVSKELRKTDVDPVGAKEATKTEGATVAKLGIKVGGELSSLTQHNGF